MATQSKLKPNQFLVDKRGKPQGVILSIVDYRKLVHLIEDLADSKALKRAVRTSRRTLSHAALVERLKAQHLI